MGFIFRFPDAKRRYQTNCTEAVLMSRLLTLKQAIIRSYGYKDIAAGGNEHNTYTQYMTLIV